MPLSVSDLLSEAARRDGERPALVSDDRIVTYAELDAAASRMARSLGRLGIGPGDLVALWTPKSIEAVITIWGVMKSGAAYVPVDASAPALRLLSIARDCRIKGLVTTGSRAAEIAPRFSSDLSIAAIWYVDEGPSLWGRPAFSWSEAMDEEPLASTIDIRADDLASVVYTSGSTGTPKGVMAPHRAIVWQSRFLAQNAKLTSDDRVAGLTPLHSSMSTFDLCSTTQTGAALHLSNQPLFAFPSLLSRFLSERRITACLTVPTLLMQLVLHGNLSGYDLSALRVIILSGEAPQVKYLRELHRVMPQTRLVNVYGRTEAKIFTWHEITEAAADDDLRLTMGKPSPDCKVFVLDDMARPVPEGSVGELWISGPNVMSGYWGSPEATSEVLAKIEAAPGKMVVACRTGDLVRQRTDGHLEFIGRVDDQVKLRGFRIELGEVEAVLNRHPAVEQAAAFVNTVGGEPRLAAVVVPRESMSIEERELRRHCAASLPPHMVPERIEFLKCLPLTSTGKLDRRRAASAHGKDRSAE